jgi:hypothetical protein
MSTKNEKAVQWIVLDPDELPRDTKSFKQTFGDNIVGQPNAEKVAVSAFERANNPLRNKKKPLGIYVLIGPSRTGKTKSGKVMAKGFHGDEDAVTVLEMGDYIEQHQMLDLTGAGPTFVGYMKPEDVAKLKPEDIDPTSKISTHNLRRVRLGSKSDVNVVILNEFEKSTDEVYRFWMGVFDNGFAVHGNGMKSDYSNTIFILTMNLGMDELKKFAKGRIGFGGGPRKVTEKDVTEIVDEALKAKYKSEFLNRLTSIVIFRPLTPEEVLQICGIEVRNIQKRIDDQLPDTDAFTLDVTDGAKAWLVAQSLKDEGDVSELTRVVEREIADRLGRQLQLKKIKGGDIVVIEGTEEGAKLEIKVEKSNRKVDSDLPALLPAPASRRGRHAGANSIDDSDFETRLDAAIERAKDGAAVDLYNVTFISDREENVQRFFARLTQELREYFGGVPVISFYMFKREPFTASLVVETSLEMIHLIKERYRHARISPANSESGSAQQ